MLKSFQPRRLGKKIEEKAGKRPVGLTLLYVGFAAVGVMQLIAIGSLFLFYPTFSLLLPWIREPQPILLIASGVATVTLFAVALGLRRLKLKEVSMNFVAKSFQG